MFYIKKYMGIEKYDYTKTRNQIIYRAMRIVGAASLYSPLEEEELEQGAEVLNDLLKSWQSKDILLWNFVEKIIPLVVNTKSYNLTDTEIAIIDVDRVLLEEENGDETRLKRKSYPLYHDIINKEETGKPIYYTLTKELEPKIILYPVPDKAYNLNILAVERQQDIDSAEASPNVLPAFFNALVYGLANLLADEYKLSISERQHIQEKAETLFSEAKAMNTDMEEDECVEGSYDY